MIQRIKIWYNLHTGKRYWYQAKYVYMVDGVEQFKFYKQVGLLDKSLVLNHRFIKKIVPPLHELHWVQGCLNNGILAVEEVTPLGYFKRCDNNNY